METQVKDAVYIRNNVYDYLFPFDDCRTVSGNQQLEIFLWNKFDNFIPAVLVWSESCQTFNERKAVV